MRRKFYCSFEEEHSQRHLEKSRLSVARRGVRDGRADRKRREERGGIKERLVGAKRLREAKRARSVHSQNKIVWLHRTKEK